MAESDIFVSNDIEMDVNFGEVFVVDPGGVYKVIASKYSSTATYVVGAYVLHLEKLYRCITAVSEPEEFDAEKWTQVLLADEVQIANANIALKADADSVYDKSAVDSALALKANESDVYAKTDTYNKTEVNNALATKADANTTYSKTEVDNALALKADSNLVYSKSDTDTLLATKADTATTYTKTEVNTALENKANSADVYVKTETYSKAEIDTNIYTKSETYNKTEVDALISNLPEPMIFKGTLGVGGTIETLPTAGASNEGWTYKVITDGTYAEQAAKVGDVFISNGSAWVLIPAGDEDSDTWRAIKVNGVEKLGNAISSGSVDFVDTTNIKFEFDSQGNAVKATLSGIDTSSEVDAKVAGLIDDTSESSTKTWSGEKINGDIKSANSNNYAQKLMQTLKVGENILTEESVVLGDNWSGTIASGITHTSGSTSSLEFNIPTTYGKAYLVTFDATGVNNTTALNVKIGDLPLVDIYNGRTDFVVGFISDGGNLVFTPKSNYIGTITNLKLREITEEGEVVTFEVKNVNTNADNSGISGFWNVALGFDSFDKNENGSRNVALGFQSLHAFKSGTRNLALGTFAMHRLESGDRNIAVGADSMWYAQKATDCIAFGHNAMSGVGTDIEHNIAIGQDSLGGLTTGKNNVAIGFGALTNPQTNNVSSATAIGVNAGTYGHTYGTYIGNRAGYFMKGVSNTCIGYNSGAAQYASGARNTFIGATCGIDNTGATSSNPKNVDDSIAIGYGAKVTKDNQVVLGNASATEFVFGGRAIDKNKIAEIDDTSTTNNKTWSSNKISAELEALLPVSSASGAVANFITSLALPLVSVKAEIVATQEAGTPTPASPKAISGVSAVNVFHLGGNFFNKNTVESGKLINASGNEVTYTDWSLSDYIEVIEGASYYFYGLTAHPNTNQDNFELFDASKNKVGFANVKIYEQPYLIPNGVKYIKICVKNSDLDTAQFGVFQNLSYCPYSPEIEKYIINLGGTYYGGYVEQDKDGHRELVVTHEITDLGEQTWYYSVWGSGYVFSINLPGSKDQAVSGVKGDILCSIYNNVSASEMYNSNPNYSMCLNRTNIRIANSDYSDKDTFKTAMDGIMLIYELAEPFTVALPDGEPITAFNGVNNVWNDTNGDTTVNYKLGIQAYIDKKIAEVQALVL